MLKGVALHKPSQSLSWMVSTWKQSGGFLSKEDFWSNRKFQVLSVRIFSSILHIYERCICIPSKILGKAIRDPSEVPFYIPRITSAVPWNRRKIHQSSELKSKKIPMIQQILTWGKSFSENGILIPTKKKWSKLFGTVSNGDWLPVDSGERPISFAFYSSLGTILELTHTTSNWKQIA